MPLNEFGCNKKKHRRKFDDESVDFDSEEEHLIAHDVEEYLFQDANPDLKIYENDLKKQ
jgi:hypothetical protein